MTTTTDRLALLGEREGWRENGKGGWTRPDLKLNVRAVNDGSFEITEDGKTPRWVTTVAGVLLIVDQIEHKASGE